MGGLSLTLSAWWIRSAVMYEPFPCVAARLAAMIEDGHETVRILHPSELGLRFRKADPKGCIWDNMRCQSPRTKMPRVARVLNRTKGIFPSY